MVKSPLVGLGNRLEAFNEKSYTPSVVKGVLSNTSLFEAP